MHVVLDAVPLRARGHDRRPRSCPASRRSGCARSSRPERGRRVPRRSARNGRSRPRHRRGHRHRAGSSSSSTARSSWTSRRGPVAHEGPVYRRPYARPAWQDALQAEHLRVAGAPGGRESCGELILRMAASPNLCSRAWVTDQYDRYVRGNTVLAQPADAGIVRVAENLDDPAMSTGPSAASRWPRDCNGRYTLLDPYAGAQLALAEAYRNVATTGAVPVAVTNCLNFGSPEDPAVMWQFAQAVRGLADGCAHARDSRHRRQCQPVQPDRRRGHPAHAGRRRARRDRRRTPAHRFLGIGQRHRRDAAAAR